jgi:Flp pilus assembly pilin Flp
MLKNILPGQNRSSKGQTAIEYMLILSAVSAIVLVGFRTYLTTVNKSSKLYFNRAATGVMGKPNPCGDGVCCCENCSPCDGEETPENCCIDCGGCDTIQGVKDCQFLGYGPCVANNGICGPGTQTATFDAAEWGGEECDEPAVAACTVDCCGNGTIQPGEVCDTLGPNFGANTCASYGCFSCSRLCNNCTSISLSACSNCGDGTCGNAPAGWLPQEACNVCVPDCGVCSCTGVTPTNATLCPNDGIGLTSNVPITLVSACGAPKCEYRCNANYHIFNNGCRQDACVGVQSPGSTQCPGDFINIHDRLDIITRANSTGCTSRKCEVYCWDYWRLFNNVCIQNVCVNPGGYDLSHATLCPNDNLIPGISDVALAIVGNGSGVCTDAQKCEYYCAPPYIKIGTSCEIPVCTGAIPANSQLCPGSIDPPTDGIYPRTLVGTCTGAPCQYRCIAPDWVYSAGTCRELCASSCSCTTYTDAYMTNISEQGSYKKVGATRYVRIVDRTSGPYHNQVYDSGWIEGTSFTGDGKTVSWNRNNCTVTLSGICSKQCYN